MANTIDIIGVRASIHDGGGVDVLKSESTGVLFVLTPQDNAIDTVYFRSALQQKIDLGLFGASQSCSYADKVLTVNGEKVTKIQGDFALERDVVNGCAAAGVPPPATQAPDVEPVAGIEMNYRSRDSAQCPGLEE